MADLASLQQWLQQTILAGGADSLAPVRQSNRLPAATRVSVYVNGYRLRLIECLQKEFPILRRLLGEHPFDLLARAYVETNPSHSYTLYEFGAGFAAYLAARQPPALGDIAGMPAALARIERAKAEVYRARGHKAAAQAEDTPFLHSLVASRRRRAGRRRCGCSLCPTTSARRWRPTRGASRCRCLTSPIVISRWRARAIASNVIRSSAGNMTGWPPCPARTIRSRRRRQLPTATSGCAAGCRRPSRADWSSPSRSGNAATIRGVQPSAIVLSSGPEQP